MAISKERKKALANAMSGINKKFGINTIGYAKTKEKEMQIKFYRTPCDELNLALGGGIGVGRVIELFGNESSGKTSLALEILAKEQKRDPNFIGGFFETEESWDPVYAKMLGVDLNRVIYWDQKEVSAEQGFDVLRSIVESGQCGMVIINSVAGLSPTAESDGEMGDQQMALTARLMSKFLRIMTGKAAKNHCSLIFINQVRANIGVKYGETNIGTGGQALRFYASQRIKTSIYKLKAKEDPITAEEGIKIHCAIKKNRLSKGANPYKECDVYAIYGKGINNTVQLPQLLEREGIVRKSGAYWYYENENGEILTVGGLECKFASRAKFLTAIETNDVLRKTLVEALDGNIVKGKVKGISSSAEEIDAIIDEDKEAEKLIKKVDKNDSSDLDDEDLDEISATKE